MDVCVSVEDNILSIRFGVNGRDAVYSVEIAHPFVTLVSHISRGSLKGLELHPLYIVEDQEEELFPLEHEEQQQPLRFIAHEEEEEEEEKKPPHVDQQQLQRPPLVQAVMEGLLHHPPVSCEDGVNGAYLLKNKDGEIIAVFKPQDEEGRGSPKRKKDDEFKDRGIIDGEGAQREVAAFLLDADGFAGVPPTMMATLENFNNLVEGEEEINKGPKTGSLQAFIENDGCAEDIGPAVFPVREVHKIGILDLRIFNNDRHSGNILYKKGKDGVYQLVPIDHGLSLSPTLEHGWFDWLMWPQAKKPFDDETKEYIANLDVEKDAQVLEELGVRPECVRTMKITTAFLKKATAGGLTLYDIGSIAARTVPEEPSELELMVEEARGQYPDQEVAFFSALYSIMDTTIARRRKVM